MKQQVPGWVIGLLLIGVAAVLICPPWEYQPMTMKEGGKPGFKGWHTWWYKTPPIEGGNAEGTHQKWNVKTTYVVAEILVVGVVVFALGTIAGKKAQESLPPAEAPEPTDEQSPPAAT